MSGKQNMDGAQALIHTLENLGVEYIFGYSGGAVIPIFDAIVTTKTKIKLINVRHEQGAVHMADGYARATGKPGVVLVTSGPGAGNAITGLMTAHMDNVPMILISGQQITSMIGMDAFQETDVINLSVPVVKHRYQIYEANDIPKTVHKAFDVTMNGRRGPVVIDIPKDVSSAPFTGVISLPVTSQLAEPVQTHNDSLKGIAEALSGAKRPLLLVGHGVLLSDASSKLHEFINTHQIPVVTTLLGKGAFDENSSLHLGMLGMHGTAYANKAIQETDCLLNVGSRFDDRIIGEASQFCDQAVKCHIDIDPTEINKMVTVDHAVVCDAKLALSELQELVDIEPNKAWLSRISELKNEFPLHFTNHEGLSQQAVIEALYQQTNKNNRDAIVTTDVGQHQMWAAQFFKTKSPDNWLTSGGAGTMGFGMPAAIGAQLGRPNETVISISGDGGFQMTQAELATAAIHKLPIKIVILDNKYLGMVRQWQELFYDDRESGVSLEGNPNFVALAAAYGIKGVHITHTEHLDERLTDALDYSDGPVVIWCEVVKTENVYPMIPAGKSYDHMLIEAPTAKLAKPVGST